MGLSEKFRGKKHFSFETRHQIGEAWVCAAHIIFAAAAAITAVLILLATGDIFNVPCFYLLNGIVAPVGRTGADVIILIFGDFCQFSTKQIGDFLINQCYDQIFAKCSSSLRKKRQYIVSPFYGENIFKIITSVLGQA
jgi:hypothetical protein